MGQPSSVATPNSFRMLASRQSAPKETEEQWGSRRHTRSEIEDYVANMRARTQAQWALRYKYTPARRSIPASRASSPNANDTITDLGESKFFNGLTAQQAAQAMQIKIPNRFDPYNQSPGWAKQHYEMGDWREDVEQAGREDSMGFY